jgi:hypothetical protein
MVSVPCPPGCTVKLADVGVSEKSGGSASNVAVTDALAVTLQPPAPEQFPLQPEKSEPAAAVAMSATVDPLTKFAEHDVPQLIPAGLLVTVPLPLPANTTETLKLPWVGVSLNTTPQPIPQLPEMPAVDAVP